MQDILHADRGCIGEQLQGFARTARTGGAQFAVRMESFLTPTRAEENWSCPFHAEQVGSCIYVRNVYQAAGSQVDTGVSFVVRSQGAVVIDPGRHIAEMGRGDCCARGGFEIEDVKRLNRVGDYGPFLAV